MRNNGALQGERGSTSKRKEQCLAIQAKEIKLEAIYAKMAKEAHEVVLNEGSGMKSKGKKVEQSFEP